MSTEKPTRCRPINNLDRNRKKNLAIVDQKIVSTDVGQKISTIDVGKKITLTEVGQKT